MMQRARARKWHALFAGPYEVVSEETERRVYPHWVYDLRAYVGEVAPSEAEAAIPIPLESRPEQDDWVEGATREQLEAAKRARRKADAVTGATPGEDRVRWRSVYRERIPSGELRISYPPDGAVFPPNLCAPYVEWEDAINDLWQVAVEIPDRSLEWTFVTTQQRWRFPPEVWRVIREHAGAHDAHIQIKGVQRSDRYTSASEVIQASPVVRFRVSEYPVDDYIVYRLVSPQFQIQKTPDMFIRDVQSFEVEPFLSARREYCFNCHTFSSKAGTEGMMSIKMRHVVGTPASGLGIFDLTSGVGKKVTLPYPHKGFTFTSWSFSGDKLAISANQAFHSARPIIHETQELDYSWSDIAVYDLHRDRVLLVPGADSPDYIEIYPAWPPDGKRLVFSRAKAGVSARIVQYDLYVVDYNDGKGGTPIALEGASHNNKSNYFARFSPNGKWMCFCMADQGSLIECSSDLYVLPGDLRGPAHPLECNVDYAADSWHCWSSNSRWILFASKRDDGIYARLYLTQIDDEGHASPAVRVPLRKVPLATFNIPEFLANKPRMKERQIFEAIRAEAPTIALRMEKSK